MSVRQPVSLRVPELGPHLGKLIAGAASTAGGIALDDIRLRLVNRIIEQSGEARRLAARGELRAALAAVGRTAWLEAWEEAVGDIAQRLADRVEEELQAQAYAVRMPRRRRRRLALGADERRALAARLGAVGAGFVAALDRLEGHAGQVEESGDPAKMAHWQDALTRVARRLEGAWLDIERALAAEADRFAPRLTAVARWRKPWWPVFALGVPVMIFAVWVGLLLGGYLAPPGFWDRLWGMLAR